MSIGMYYRDQKLTLRDRVLAACCLVTVALCAGIWPRSSSAHAQAARSWMVQATALSPGARAIVSESAGGGSNSAPMAFDRSGNLWISDVRGVGLQEFSPSGAPRSFWPVHNPRSDKPEVLGSIAFNSADDLYAYASDVNQIWEFSARGRYLRAIGSPGLGRGGYSAVADVAVSPHGTVYVADSGRSRVDEYSPSGAWLGLLGSGREGSSLGAFSRPSDVAVDRQGNVYVADAGNNRIERFNAHGVLTAHWPIVHGGYASIYNLAVGSDGSSYVIDSAGDRLDRYSFAGKLVWSASAVARAITPFSVAVGPGGRLYVGNHSLVYRISATGAVVQHLALPGTQVSQLRFPSDLAVDSAGNVLVADTCYLNCISGLVEIHLKRTGAPVWSGIGDATVASAVAVSGHGSVYAGTGSDTVQKYIASHRSQARWQLAFRGSEPTGITAIAATGHGKLYASDYNGFLWSFTPHGHLLKLVAHFRHILSIAVDRAGDVFVSDVNAYLMVVGQPFPTQHGRVIELSPAGRELHVWATPVISSLAIDGRGHIFAAEYTLDRIAEFSSSLQPLARWGGYGYAPGQFDHPSGIALDKFGRIYVADTDNDRVQMLSSTGNPLAVWGVRYQAE